MRIGAPVLAFESLESTNKMAAELFGLSKVQHGAVIMANEQTAGRGQRDRVWVAQKGADLTVSVVLEPPGLRAEDQFVLSKLAALAVSDVVRTWIGGPVAVKWPNDVLVGRRKIAGILIENDVMGERVACSVVGIGINVNSSGFPEDLMATSMLLESGGRVDLTDVLTDLCGALDKRWQAWVAGDAQAEDYASALWAKGRWVAMVLDGVPVTARPMEVDRHGRLIVELEGGAVNAYSLDQLRFAPR
ncbi:MAG: biotin--[acetyl-CoA-carboxylase] ligase [Flavobacteriales bacterium]|nr:biotin--[acetyl-CoA-carboxylase] ligase [Flavobacteriales bacterium]